MSVTVAKAERDDLDGCKDWRRCQCLLPWQEEMSLTVTMADSIYKMPIFFTA